MKYHAIPLINISKLRHNDSLSKKVKQSAEELHLETVLAVKKMHKRDPEMCSSVIYYLYDKDSMRNLMEQLSDNDEIIVHGEGMPFVFGLAEPSPYDLHAQSLATLLHENKMPDCKVNITLLSCQSGTTYAPDDNTDINFARDMSRGLHALDYHNVSVTGYTGFVVVKNGGKYSVSSTVGTSTKGTHSNLDDAKMVYTNGRVVFNGRIMTDNLSDMIFDWASEYIKQAILGQKIILLREQSKSSKWLVSSYSQSMFSLFDTSTEGVSLEITHKGNMSDECVML